MQKWGYIHLENLSVIRLRNSFLFDKTKKKNFESQEFKKKIKLVFEGLKKDSDKVATYESIYGQLGSETRCYRWGNIKHYFFKFFGPKIYSFVDIYKEASHCFVFLFRGLL